MKAELYMTSPEQEFSLDTIEQGPTDAPTRPRREIDDQQWLRLWMDNWIRAWDRNWIRAWDRQWIRAWDRWERWNRTWVRGWDHDWIRWMPWDDLDMEKGDPATLKPLVERLLLRREEEGFLAMDTLTSRVFKLDEEAGKIVQLLQDGASPKDAAKKAGAKAADLEELMSFLERHDVRPKE